MEHAWAVLLLACIVRVNTNARCVLVELFFSMEHAELHVLRDTMQECSQTPLWSITAQLAVQVARHVSVTHTTTAGPATKATIFMLICVWHTAQPVTLLTTWQVHAFHAQQHVPYVVHFRIARFAKQVTIFLTLFNVSRILLLMLVLLVIAFIALRGLPLSAPSVSLGMLFTMELVIPTVHKDIIWPVEEFARVVDLTASTALLLDVHHVLQDFTSIMDNVMLHVLMELLLKMAIVILTPVFTIILLTHTVVYHVQVLICWLQ